jgi:hypothetical protein
MILRMAMIAVTVIAMVLCAGFVLDTETLQSIARRYGGRDGKMTEDDFMQSFCKVLALYRKW